MSILNKIGSAIQSFLTGIKNLIHFVSGAIARIFAPIDDEYPNTGVQPFEGELPDKKSKHYQA
ncbi:MAG TPA: hypothetical protein DDW76_32810 [Cyanobacteria bacterium UBA11369]|nr:hypothetical protein [Cyanobacteria bacterium UBA11371]HBE30657.1 hypothetical protein [Cyanobacteria bacterium UBA11368]HBE53409.1 hypothetical protein [Cyanobacteria bacterium UBA11369]